MTATTIWRFMRPTDGLSASARRDRAAWLRRCRARLGCQVTMVDQCHGTCPVGTVLIVVRVRLDRLGMLYTFRRADGRRFADGRRVAGWYATSTTIDWRD